MPLLFGMGGGLRSDVENNQEILDSVIMAYRIGEDPEVPRLSIFVTMASTSLICQSL